MTDERVSIGSAEARALAKRALGTRAGAPRPDDATLAAWLDGRLAEDATAPVERWIAEDPAAAAEILGLREALSDDPGPAPAAFVARAQAIVRAPAHGASPSLFDRLFGQGSGVPALRWGAVAAVALLVAYGGFEVGSHGIAPTLAGERGPGAVQEADLDFGAQPAPLL